MTDVKQHLYQLNVSALLLPHDASNPFSQSTQCLELAPNTALPTGHLIDATKWRSGACNFKTTKRIGDPYPQDGLDDYSVFERRMKPTESKVVVEGDVEQVGNVFGPEATSGQ